MTTDTQTNDTQVSLIDRLFAVGAHFGFSKARRHPTATPYLFANKQGTDIFDLEKTSALLTDAAAYLKEAGAAQKTVLFVGTKEEVQRLVRAEAERIDAPYVVHRWIGGTLTNFSEIKRRLDRYATLESQRESGELERKYTKKERLMVAREVEKLTMNFGGIKDLERLPNLLVVIDPRHDALAVREATLMNIPVVAIMGSDCDATDITKPVYVNDAHQQSVSFVLRELTDAYQEGRSTQQTGE